MTDMRLWLPEASRNATTTDIAFAVVFAICLTVFLILFVLLVIFAIRYRRGARTWRGPLPSALRREIEIGWTAGTTFLAIFIFLYFVGGVALPPRNSPGQVDIQIVAKQWMWKAQHPDGAREIDALHLPVNTPVHLVMTSQDVIHSFFVPAFRLKQDVLPGRNTQLFFTPTETGTFHLFCAEYCGTQHSHMLGEIVVMQPQDYANWLRFQPHGDSLVRQGEALYTKFGCDACHAPTSQVKAPKLDGLYGSVVLLSDGRRVRADDVYIAKSVLRPRDDVVAGYAPVMPSYGQLARPSDISALVAYIKSLRKREPGL